MLSFLLDLIFPKRCVGCNRFGDYFCNSCVKKIKQDNLVCPFCERNSIGGVIHPVCQRRFGLDGLWSVGTYEYPLKQAIHELKYRYITGLSIRLIEILLEYWALHNPFFLDLVKKDQGQGWVVASVPLHKSRQNWRGFNQAELLAKLLSQKLGLEYHNILKRIKKTKPQVNLAADLRRQNIKGAFVAIPKEDLIDKKVILIDDVWTTGSTLKECCYVLKRSGVQKVWALTLAR